MQIYFAFLKSQKNVWKKLEEEIEIMRVSCNLFRVKVTNSRSHKTNDKFKEKSETPKTKDKLVCQLIYIFSRCD